MPKQPLLLISCLLIVVGTAGYGLGHYIARHDSSDVFTQKPTSPTIASGTMTIEAAQLQRKDHYQNVNSIPEILSLPSLFAQNEALYAVAGRANKLLLLKLLKETAGVGNTQQRNSFMQILVARLTELDPKSAANIAIDAYKNNNYSLVHDVFKNWAKLDADAAVKRANRIEEQNLKESASQGILAAIDVNNVAFRIELSERLGIQTNEQQYVSDALIEKGVQDPESAIEEALLMPRGYERENAMLGIIDSWAAEDPELAFEFTQRVNDKLMQQRLQEAVLYRWAESDPQTAYEVMQSLPHGNISNISYSVFTNIANQDPRDALAFIENIHSSRSRSDAYSATVTAWAAKDAEAAASYVAQLDNKQLKQKLAPTVVQYLSAQSPEDALNWAREMDPGGQLYLQDTVIGQIAAQNPDRAFQIAQTAQQATLRQQLSLSVINSLAYSDPVRAAELIDQLPSNEVNSELVNSVIYGWGNSDPESAMAWLNSKSGSLREDGLISLGSQLASVDPDMAASYLPQLNGAVRNSWAENITYYYASYDLNEAATWVENFRGEAVYGDLLTAVASTAASTDVDYALELAQNMPSADKRNALIRQIADQISYSYPQRAEQLYARLPPDEAPEG